MDNTCSLWHFKISCMDHTINEGLADLHKIETVEKKYPPFPTDLKIEYVCKEFAITKEQLFSKSRKREIADARSVLYALMGTNSYVIGKTLLEDYQWQISASGILNGIAMANKYLKSVVDGYSIEAPPVIEPSESSAVDETLLNNGVLMEFDDKWFVDFIPNGERWHHCLEVLNIESITPTDGLSVKWIANGDGCMVVNK